MEQAVAIIGMGEMGGVFARGLLKLGHPVYPITRDMNFQKLENRLPELEAVVVAAGEKDLKGVLEKIPDSWKKKLVLLQNELLPKDWIVHSVDPTVISVWFEKKRPNDYKVIIPSPVFGPQADLIACALGLIDIPCRVIESIDDLLFELVVKNLYILTVNIAGLEVGGTVDQLWKEHNDLALAVANDVLDIQFRLIGKKLDRQKLIDGMVEAFDGDLEHKCMGRSAPARLERALTQADEFKLDVPKLRSIQSAQTNPVSA